MEYPKINSLWKREGWYFDQGKKNSPDHQKGRQSLIIGDYAEQEFGNIKKWRVDEKVDGTNIRIYYTSVDFEDTKIRTYNFYGRTNNAQIPIHLQEYLNREITLGKLIECFGDARQVVLYGEGYGPKIQGCGGNYRSDPGFILFDVFCSGWWLKWQDVIQIAQKLGVPSTPHIGEMTEDEIVDYVKSKPISRCSMIPQMMEGVICRSDPLVLFRNGNPVKFKLKCKEFT